MRDRIRLVPVSEREIYAMEDIHQPPSPKCFRYKTPHGGVVCCVQGCKNKSSMDKANGLKRSYHRFPIKKRELLELWLDRIGRANWVPKSFDRICSDHFVGGKSKDPTDPGYVPTIFPSKQKQSKKLKTLNMTKTVSSSISSCRKRKHKSMIYPVSSDSNQKSEINPDSSQLPAKNTKLGEEIKPFSSPSHSGQKILKPEIKLVSSSGCQQFVKAEAASSLLPAKQQTLPAETKPATKISMSPTVTFANSSTPSQGLVSLLPPNLGNLGKNSCILPKASGTPACTSITAKENRSSISKTPGSKSLDVVQRDVTPESESLHIDHDYFTAMPSQVQNNKELLELQEQIQALRKENEKLKKKVFGIEMCKDNDRVLKYYTNIPKYSQFAVLSKYVRERSNGRLKYWKGSETKKHAHFSLSYSKKPGPVRLLSFEDELFLVLMKFKSGVDNLDLHYRFGICESSVSRIITTWTSFLKNEVTLLDELPTDELTDIESEVKALLKRVQPQKKKEISKSSSAAKVKMKEFP